MWVKKLKKIDLWKVASVLLIISGLETTLLGFFESHLWGGVIIGGVNVLFGCGMWQKSLATFRVLRIIFLGSLFFSILDFFTHTSIPSTIDAIQYQHFGFLFVNLLNILLNLGTFIAVGLLWKQLRDEKRIGW